MAERFGGRLRRLRNQTGMSRALLGDWLGKSGEWVKALEAGRLHTPRLPVLVRIAHELGIADLVELTGEMSVPVSAFAGERHAALTAVQAALTDYRVAADPGRPVSVDHLAARLRQAWAVRHSSPDHRTQLGTVLPGLIRDGQRAVRLADLEARRGARRVLAGVYQLADFFVAYQPAPELVWMVADRALTEGQETDDPYVIGGGSWAMVQALRDAGRWEEATALAGDAIRQITPYLGDDAPADWHGLVGALEAEIAYVHARRGRVGDAWAHMDRAQDIARRLGPGYRHVQSSFSLPVMGAHATTVGVELCRPGEALHAARGIDPADIVSVPRRARHLIEVARAHGQRGESASVLHLLDQSTRTAPETIKYNGFARDLLADLLAQPPAGMREDVRNLAVRVGLTAA